MMPALVQWEFTDRCNYRCSHCYHLDQAGNYCHQSELSDEELWQIAEILAANQLFFVTFTGGEPLVRKKLLIEIAWYLNQAGIILSLNTNLVLLDEETLGELKVHRILVSCPATDTVVYREVTGGDYAVFESKLKMVIEAKKEFTVNMVISQRNRHLIRDTAAHLAGLGIKRFAATPMSLNAGNPRFDLVISRDETFRAIEDLVWVHEAFGLEVDIMESIPKCLMPKRAFELCLPFVYRSCHAGGRNGTISTSADIRPCSHNPQIFGNLLMEDIGDIWDRMQGWRQQTSNQHMDCLSCDLFTRCGGGCRIDAQVRTGESSGKHPYMTERPGSIIVEPEPVPMSPETTIRPVHSFQSRRENGGWLVAPGSSRNIIEVNETLYQFLVATRHQPPMTFQAIAEKFGTTFNDPEYQRIMQMLMRKRFFVLTQ